MTDRLNYNPDKELPTTKFYNQKYSGSMYKEFDYSEKTQKARFDKRTEAYKKWQNKNKPISNKQLEQEPQDQIGAVSSSWLTSLGYNAAASEAVATFNGSDAEFYFKMDYKTFLEWLNSPSKGKWLHDHPGIMHDYSMRGGRGGKSMETRMSSFHTANKLKNRGDKALLKKKVKKYLLKYR